jgi:hypothetical protein
VVTYQLVEMREMGEMREKILSNLPSGLGYAPLR